MNIREPHMPNLSLTKLLLVDDDPDSLLIAAYCLESLKGVTIKTVSSGQAAIQEALVFIPDLILLDEMMPQMDGLTTMKTLRLIPILSHIPVVFFTAKVQKEEVSSFLKAGAIDVITKPFDPITLSSTILAIWKKHIEEASGTP